MICNVACIQLCPSLGKKEENLKKMLDMLEKTLKEKPETQLVVFPELATTGYQCGREFLDLAETVSDDSLTVGIFASLAKKHNIHIIWGMAEKDACNPDILYNSQVLMSNKGKIVGVYRKVHLFDSEKQWFTPGKRFEVYDTEIGRIGLFVCYDAFFPEAARIMAIKGVDLLVNSTNWEKPYDYDMDMVMCARALENTVYLACCNRIGTDTTLGFFGHTRILDPLGRVITSVEGETEDFIFATLDFAKAEKMKSDYYTMLTERRPELYTELCR